MDYFEFEFIVKSREAFWQDLLINALSEAGFDTFEESSDGFNAYIPASAFNEDMFIESLAGFNELFAFSYHKNTIKARNWNELWESNFVPITIKDQCYVRATFHSEAPEYPFEIVIDPKMSFGTGHHQTTSMMLAFILEEDFKHKAVLDMGCGTGILAILAAKKGAAEVVAIDNDPVCYQSTLENFKLNGVGGVATSLCGSKEAIPVRCFDRVLANINRNILLDQLAAYSQVLVPDGSLFLSGFYEADCDILLRKANDHSLRLADKKQDGEWVCLKLIKA